MTGTVFSEYAGHLCGISLHVRAAHFPSEASATLRLYEQGGTEPIREVTRHARSSPEDQWYLFPFAAVADSHDQWYRFSIETTHADVSRALSVDADGSLDARTSHGASLGLVLDPWLSRLGQALPPVPARFYRYLDRHVLECIRMQRHFLLRLAHLADAIGRIPDPINEVLSIGAGAAFQEAFLAARFPDMQVLATDVDQPPTNYPFPNLRFARLDLRDPPDPTQYDLVFSIECLEYIEDYRRAFRHQVAMVKPDKYLYLSVPFASLDEQRDAELCQRARDLGRHWPGFSFEDLEDLCRENGVEILHASNMFHVDLIVPVRQIVDEISDGELECGAEAIAQLLLLDLQRPRAANSRQAEGIRILGRRT